MIISTSPKQSLDFTIARAVIASCRISMTIVTYLKGGSRCLHYAHYHYKWFWILFLFCFSFAGAQQRFLASPPLSPPRANGSPKDCALTGHRAVATKLCVVARVIALIVRQASAASALQDGSVVGSTPCVKVCVSVRACVCVIGCGA